MAHTVKVLAWLYRSKMNKDGKIPVYLRITKDRQRVEIATGYFINASDWNARTHKVKRTSSQAQEVNEYLQTQRFKITKTYNQLIADEKPFTLSVLKNKLKGNKNKQTTLMEAINYHTMNS